jgi:hypothetical protein
MAAAGDRLMKWQLPNWSIGQFLIPVGTIVSGVAGPGDGQIAEAPKWQGTQVLPLPLPLNAVALDAEAAIMMLIWYQPPAAFWYQIEFAPGIDRAAIEARARATGLVHNWG